MYVIYNGNVYKIESVEDLEDFVGCKIELENNKFDAALVAERQEKEIKKERKALINRNR